MSRARSAMQEKKHLHRGVVTDWASKGCQSARHLASGSYLQLGSGTFSLPHLMMRYDEAALAQRRDAAPLRLILLANIWDAEVASGHCGGANDALWQPMS